MSKRKWITNEIGETYYLNGYGEPVFKHEEEDLPKKTPRKKQKNEHSRGWCFTIPGHTIESFSMAACLFEDNACCTYVIIGFEVGETTAYDHLQGYAYFPNKVSTNWMKKQLPNIHIETQKGTNIQALVYCMEDYEWTDWGKMPCQGKRTDLDAIKHLLLKKKTLNDIARDFYPRFCQYSRQFKEFQDMNPQYKGETELIVYDDDTIHKVMEYNQLQSLIFEDNYFTKSDVLFKYYSGRYKYIFIPARNGISVFGKLITEVLENSQEDDPLLI